MEKQQYILAIDQGTSSTKSLIFDNRGIAVARGSEPLQTNYSDNGFVEQDPELIWQNVIASVSKCLIDFAEKGFNKNDIGAIGISNQRETFVVWDKNGKPLHPAVVWQCKRSVQVCEILKKRGMADEINQRTGLFIDPYFSGTKLIWLQQHNQIIRQAIQTGNAFFGTIDTWLLYKMTNGAAYTTDYTNASRTLFFNLNSLQWDAELINAFGLTGIQLPQISPSAYLFGSTTLDGLFDSPVRIASMIGDSHAAAFGEGCFDPGTAKATLGTGSSILMNIGPRPALSKNGMVTTVCWSTQGRVDFAYEGVIVSCGATIEWLKKELNLFNHSSETEAMANAVADNGGVYLIPAFSGLGSPHWQMDRRASISGMSFGTTKNHLVRAALESIPYQIKDVISAMETDAGIGMKELNVDGGLTANQFVVQFISDLLNKKVATIGMPDVSALGAALLAGLKVGIFENIESLKALHSEKKYFYPINTLMAEKYYRGWQLEVGRV